SEKVNILLGQGGPLSNINKIDGNFIVESTTIFNYASSGEPPTRPTRPNNSRPFIILGTYEGWSYSPESGNPFQIHNIDVNKLTHVAYAYIQPNANGSINYMDDQNDAGKRFRPFLRLKDKNENIKLLLSVGGWMEDATIFPKVIQDDATLDEFVKNLNALFKKFNFDGLNLVWLYPKTDEK
ncbi:Endochitinase, partial [Pseudolycoriella hygida]